MVNQLFDPRIDLSSQITSEEIKNENPFSLLSSIANAYFKHLSSPLGKTQSKRNRDLTLVEMLSKFYGFNGRTFSYEEIGLLTNKTKERVRQQIKDFNQFFLEVIQNKNQEFRINPSISAKITSLHTLLRTHRIISKENLSIALLSNQDFSSSDSDDEFSKLFYDTFDIVVRNPLVHHLRNNTFLFVDSRISKNDFFELCYLVYAFLEKNVLPANIEDIVIDVKRKKAQSKSEIIELAANEIFQIEKVEINGRIKYQLKFNWLSNARDKAYRLLSERGNFMKLSEIIKECNHLLLKGEKTKKITNSLANQLVTDDRFTSQGKTGYWGLTEWQGNNESLFDLITNTLIHFNKPMLKKDIYSYILSNRPQVPIRSLDTIIYDKTRYLKLTDSTFILKDWADLYKKRISNTTKKNTYIKENPIKEQIKQQVIQLLQKNSSKELYLNNVVTTLNKKFGYPKASVYGAISKNEEFITKRDSKNKPIVLLKDLPNNMTSQGRTVTSIFVSYAWETKEHENKVISFVDFLRKNGFNADLDKKIMQDETAVDFNKLMHIGIRNYDKVIVVLSNGYKAKAESFQGGVGKEYRFIINNIEKEPKKFILISFLPLTNEIIESITPIEFRGREIVDLKKDELNKFQNLFSKLTDTKIYNFSEVAKNTSIVENVEIKPFTLKDK